MNFKDKYIKYKLKYLNLKYQSAGKINFMPNATRETAIGAVQSITDANFNAYSDANSDVYSDVESDVDSGAYSDVESDVESDAKSNANSDYDNFLTYSEVISGNIDRNRVLRLHSINSEEFKELNTFTNLRGLNFSDDFDRTIQRNDLPPTIEIVYFGSNFNNGGQPLEAGVLPNSIQFLLFGNSFNNGGQPIGVNVLPNRLRRLHLGLEFTNGGRPFEVGFLPDSLRTLIIKEIEVQVPITSSFTIPS